MTDVIASFAMSLDGFVADLSDAPGPIFDWYDNGPVDVPWPGNEMVSHTSPASAAYLRQTIAGAGALLVGRRLFGLLDEVRVELVPVLLGAGIRFFDKLEGAIMLEDPEVIEGDQVTHLRYRVRRP